jgi:energy-coupling factor transporter ATP-binding protein EcfA2
LFLLDVLKAKGNMIEHFEGRNVGGFAKISVDFEPITILVGPNASGKSTVMRALRALALTVRSPLYDQRTGLMRLAGVANIADLFRDQSQEMELGVTVRSSDGDGRYAVTLGYDSARHRVEVRREFVEWSSSLGHDFRYDSTNDLLEFAYRGSDITTAVPRRTALPHLAFPFWKTDPKRYANLDGLYELTACFLLFTCIVSRQAQSRNPLLRLTPSRMMERA